MLTGKATGMGFRELSALTSSWSVAKLQEVKVHPYSASVSMLLPTAMSLRSKEAMGSTL